jgi:hypothetical protein
MLTSSRPEGRGISAVQDRTANENCFRMANDCPLLRRPAHVPPPRVPFALRRGEPLPVAGQCSHITSLYAA